MATPWSVTIVKSFPYRGAAHEWSNTYHFDGDVPATPSQWLQACDAVWNQEKTFLPASVNLWTYIGHDGTNTRAAYTKDVSLAGVHGSFGPGALDVECPGDTAATVRWSTAEFTSTGKPIYLRKYYHACYRSTSTSSDALAADQGTAIRDAAQVMVDGLDMTFGTRHIVGPRGAAGVTVAVAPFITTRTLLRRGRRPT